MSQTWQTYPEITALLDLATDDVLVRDVSNLSANASGTNGRLLLNAALGMSGITPGGRLTLESGVPVSTTNQTAKGTIYYTPYAHDFVRLWDGTRPKLYTFTERSLSLTLTSGKNYDVFIYDSLGTLTLELSAAWTTDTARADALAWQAGVGYVKSGAATRLWLGTIRASGTNTTESSFYTTDAAAKSFVWNRYNQITRTATVCDSTDSWTYTTNTIRQKRASANNQIEFVCGEPTRVESHNMSLTTNGGSVNRSCYVGVDSTTAFSGTVGYAIPATATYVSSYYADMLAAGYHYIAALERSDTGGTTTWYGDIGAPLSFMFALHASVTY